MLVDSTATGEAYRIDVLPWTNLHDLDGIVLPVPHRGYLTRIHGDLERLVQPDGAIVDVKLAVEAIGFRSGYSYWSP